MLWTIDTHRDDALGRVLTVALPEGYGARAEPYPLLVCLDAQWTFGTVCDAALNLGLARLMPRVVVVGVGWTADSARAVVHARAAAFTPTRGALPAAVTRSMADAPVYGQAADFQHWLLDEALPMLARRYAVDPADRTLIGHSLSGLFGLYTLFTRPAAFSRWLLASPSSWWDERMIFAREADAGRPAIAPGTRVFLSAGSEETLIGEIPMVANTEAMQARLAAHRNPSVDSHFVLLDGELHHSTIPAAVSRGLRWLFREASAP